MTVQCDLSHRCPDLKIKFLTGVDHSMTKKQVYEHVHEMLEE